MVSHPLSMWEALGSTPRLSMLKVLLDMICIWVSVNTFSLSFYRLTKENGWHSAYMGIQAFRILVTAIQKRRMHFSSLCLVTKTGAHTQHHQCNSCRLYCCSPRFFKDIHTPCRLSLHRITSTVIPLHTHQSIEHQSIEQGRLLSKHISLLALRGWVGFVLRWRRGCQLEKERKLV